MNDTKTLKSDASEKPFQEPAVSPNQQKVTTDNSQLNDSQLESVAGGAEPMASTVKKRLSSAARTL